MKAYVKNYRQSPRKVRLVADLVRGKSYTNAMLELEYLPKRASLAISKIIASAAANAENNFKMKKEDLVIKTITVDQGVTLKRSRPRSRGMATRINKRTSNIAVTLAPGKEKKASKKKIKEDEALKKEIKKSPSAKATEGRSQKAKAPAKKKAATKKTTTRSTRQAPSGQAKKKAATKNSKVKTKNS